MRAIWWQLDTQAVQRLVSELRAATEAVRSAADELVRRIPSGAGLAVEAQRQACQELAAQARSAAQCLAGPAEVWRGWLGEFDLHREQRLAAVAVLGRDLGRPVEPTPQEVRQALGVLPSGRATGLGPVTSGLLAVAYQRLREIDDGAQAAAALAARRLAALPFPPAPPKGREAIAAAVWWRDLLPFQRDRLVHDSPSL